MRIIPYYTPKIKGITQPRKTNSERQEFTGNCESPAFGHRLFGMCLFSHPLLIFLDRHEMPIHVADVAEIQAIIREEKADGF